MQTRRGGKQGYRSTPRRFCSKFGGDKSPLFDRFPAFSERLDAQPPGKTQINSRIPAPRRSLPCRQLTPIPSLLVFAPSLLVYPAEYIQEKYVVKKLKVIARDAKQAFRFPDIRRIWIRKMLRMLSKILARMMKLIMFFFLKPFFKIIFHQLNNFFTKFVFKICIENFASILIFESLIL